MTYFIDEPVFYELVFRSRLQSAKMFREWCFSKVLPSIRKYGYYNNNNNNNNNFIYIALKSNNCPKRYLITK